MTSQGEWLRARELVLRHGWNATCYQILNPGLSLWFAAAGDAVVGYVSHAGVRVAAGAPVCAAERLWSVAAEFEREAGAGGESVCYFCVEGRFAAAYRAAAPAALLRAGAQPVWDPQEWRGRVLGQAGIRAQLNRARNKGVAVREWPAQRAGASAELRDCLAGWLGRRGLPPLHFLVEPQTLDRLADRRVFVAERCGAVIGFVVASPVPARRGWLLEQVVRRPGAPNGTAELMIDGAVGELAESGATFLTLGLAPLARRGAPQQMDEAAWLRLLLAWVRAHGRRFYNFRGLEYFKGKFAPPRWDPVYALFPGSRVPPGSLYAVATAFSGGPPSRLLLAALRRELGRLVGGLRRGP